MLFQAPFLPEFVAAVLQDEEQTPVNLQNLAHLGLLTISIKTFKEGELVLLELHPMLRWYLQHHLSQQDPTMQERYGEVYEQLARQSYQLKGGYDQSSRMRYLVRQSLPDFEAALQYLPPAGRGTLAYHLAEPYQRLGQNPHALSLYEQALELYQELGDVRSVAVTQNAMADVLVQLGKPQQALALYEQALHTKQELGEVRGVAVTQNAMAGVLVQLGKPQQALALYEQSLGIARELGEVQGVAVIQANYSQLLFQQDEQQRALSMAWEAYSNLSRNHFVRDAQAMQQLLMSIKEQVLGPAQFDTLWEQVIREPQPDWLRDVQSRPASGQGQISTELMQAAQDFVNAEDWEATRQVVEAQQGILFRPEVEALFEQNIAQARADGDQRRARRLEMYLTILRECKADGIAATFERITKAQEDDDSDDLPFDTELITKSIAALLGSPQEKMSHMQYLAAQTKETTDEDLKALLATIQLALLSQDLSQLGRDLKGVYREAWETIVTSVEAGGVDPRLFEAIINNTPAVLGPAANRRSDWRNNLVEVRNQATVQGDRNLVGLLDAVIGLLDAGGDPAGLGESLSGVYARTWQEIVQKLPT